MVRRGAGDAARGRLPDRFGSRREHHRARVRPPRIDVQRGRVGAHHGHGGRPHLPVRGARLPGGSVSAGRSSTGTVPAARHRPGSALTALIGLAATSPRASEVYGRGRAIPRRQHQRPDQPVQPRADHHRRLGPSLLLGERLLPAIGEAARRSCATRSPRPRSSSAAWDRTPSPSAPATAAYRDAFQRDRVHRQVHRQKSDRPAN